jgi:hypothetical protein
VPNERGYWTYVVGRLSGLYVPSRELVKVNTMLTVVGDAVETSTLTWVIVTTSFIILRGEIVDFALCTLDTEILVIE